MSCGITCNYFPPLYTWRGPADRWVLSLSHFNLIWFHVVKESREKETLVELIFAPQRRRDGQLEHVRQWTLCVTSNWQLRMHRKPFPLLLLFLLGNANVSHAVTFFTDNCKCNKTQTKFPSLHLPRPTSTVNTADNRHATRRRPMKNWLRFLSFSNEKLGRWKSAVYNWSLGRERFVLFDLVLGLYRKKCLASFPIASARTKS